MKDTALPVRLAWYNLLNGAITYAGFVVPVSDGKAKQGNTNDNNYVILSTQSSSPDYTKTSNDEQVTILLDIITKQGTSASKDIADNIAGQILTLVSTTANTHNLVQPTGFQFLLLEKQDDRHLDLQLSDTTTIVRRLMTFSLRVTYF